ncbi:MAG: ABC transporter ATP-binding protein [Sulfitobacter sp.]|nr:ABC transporter ATP-binding protein [Sulfitobacter sp.]
MSIPLIDLNAVSFAPGGVAVLHDVTLQANERRIGVVGRNGSGKTSLARVLAGLVSPAAGQVQIAGVDVAKDRKAALRTVGILFQNPDHQIIFPTVEEEISFGLTQLGQSGTDAAQNTAAMLAQFDRTHWAKAAIHQLSQGQRQLVCLMSILAMRPKLIILDEPFAGLDIPTTLHLTRVLSQLDAHLVHITHDPQHLAGYDRVIWIDEGRVAQDGSGQTVIPAFMTRMQQLGEQDDFTHLSG